MIPSNPLHTQSIPSAEQREETATTGFRGLVKVHGKTVRTEVSPAAARFIGESPSAVIAEMELYFSCLIRKRVLFHAFSDHAERPDDKLWPVFPGLLLDFNAVCTSECPGSEVVDHPPLTTMPVVDIHKFVPRWLRIDLRQGSLRGEFGLA